jgi:serine/threonine protein kinase
MEEPQPVFFGRFRVVEQLGKGLQGEVYRGVDPATGDEVALKFIDKAKMGRNSMRNLKREVEAMQAVGANPHVVSLLAVDWNARVPRDLEDRALLGGPASASSGGPSSGGPSSDGSLMSDAPISVMSDVSSASSTAAAPGATPASAMSVDSEADPTVTPAGSFASDVRPPAGPVDGKLPIDATGLLPPQPDPAVNDADGREVVALTLELARGGELFNYLMHSGPFSEALSRHFFRELLAGLGHCHARGVAHRDIKAENILLSSDFSLCIADFGLSARHETEDGSAVRMRTTCGTPGYMAPEILAGARYDGAKADVWAAGVLLFIMIAGFPPFQQASRGDWWFDRIRNRQLTHFWNAHKRQAPTFPEGAQRLLERIFFADPAGRATLAQVAQDPWVKDGASVDRVELRAELERRRQTVEAKREADLAEKRAQRRAKRRAKRGRRLRKGRRDMYGSSVFRGTTSSAGGGGDEAGAGGRASTSGSSGEEGAAAGRRVDGITRTLMQGLKPPPADLAALAEAEAA